MFDWIFRLLGRRKELALPKFPTQAEIEEGLAKADVIGIKAVIDFDWSGERLAPTDRELEYWRKQLELQKAKSGLERIPVDQIVIPSLSSDESHRVWWQWYAVGHDYTLEYIYNKASFEEKVQRFNAQENPQVEA
jgi:hypothetical protein